MSSRVLLVLRHAKSDWDALYGSDHDRPISKRGRKAAKRIGIWMNARDLAPDHVLCSTAERTRQTLDRLAEFADLDDAVVEYDGTIYHAGLGSMLAAIASVPPESECVLLVGHWPGVEEIVEHLDGAPLEPDLRGKTFPTAALACLDVHVPWDEIHEACADLTDFVRPRDLV